MEAQFGAADFAVFICTLLLSASIGIYYAYKDRKISTVDNYVFGSRKLSTTAVAISMGVSLISAMTIIGFPVEVYFYGNVYIWVPIASFVASIFSAIFFVPLYYRLRLSTVYEFLERRFDKKMRTICSALMTFQMILFMGIIVYLPALALSAVTPISLYTSIGITSAICTFYTSLGGMKAVIWTDVFQAIVMFGGSLVICIKTTSLVGGIDNVFAAMARGQRNNYLNSNVDPRVRSSTFVIFIAMFFGAMADFACNQMLVQRYMACKSIRSAQIASMIRAIPIALFMIVATLNGLAMYAYYEGCDPLTAGYIEKSDQTIALLVVEIFENLPGLAGLFVSAAYSGTLSTVSSGINSIANVVVYDYISPFKPNLKERTKLLLCKGLSLLTGVLVMGIAFLTTLLRGTVVEISFIIQGTISGPIFAVYFMGAFIPFVNTLASVVGLVAGMLLCLWINVGAIVYGAKEEFTQNLPVNAIQCVNVTLTTTTNYTTPSMQTQEEIKTRPLLADTLYSLSPFILLFVGFLTTLVVSLIASLIPGINKRQADVVDRSLFITLTKGFTKSQNGTAV